MSQTLELLSLWSRFLSPEERTSLRHHIVRRLVEAQDDGNCLTISYSHKLYLILSNTKTYNLQKKLFTLVFALGTKIQTVVF